MNDAVVRAYDPTTSAADLAELAHLYPETRVAIARGQIRRTGERGMGFAIPGIVLGSVQLGFTVILVLVALVVWLVR